MYVGLFWEIEQFYTKLNHHRSLLKYVKYKMKLKNTMSGINSLLKVNIDDVTNEKKKIKNRRLFTISRLFSFDGFLLPCWIDFGIIRKISHARNDFFVLHSPY